MKENPYPLQIGVIFNYSRIVRPVKTRRITNLRRVVLLPLSSLTPTKLRVSINARIE